MIGKNLTHKQKMQLILLLILAVAIIAAAIYSLIFAQKDDQIHVVYKEDKVLSGDVVSGVTENGNLTLEESSIKYEIVLEKDEDEDEEESEDEDTISYLQIEEIFVVKGQRISIGDPLFSLTQKSMDAVSKKLHSQVTQKKIELDEATSAYHSDVLSAKSSYLESTLTAKNADMIKDASITTLYEEINSLEAEIAILELEINQCLENLTDEDFLEGLNDSKLTFDKAKKQLEETLIASPAAYSANYTEYTSAKTSYESYTNQKESWEKTVQDNQQKILDHQLEMLDLSLDLEARILEIENTYQLSKETGALAEKVYAYTADSLSDSVEQAQEAYEQAEESLTKYQTFTGEDGIIYATESGMVTAISYEAGDELITTGDVISYVKTDDYTITVDVSEEDIASISIGDEVEVLFDAYPDEDYSGTVISITTTKTSDIAKTVSYPVTILISGDTEKLFGGMTAGITFVTEQVKDVLYVSKKAIVTQDGKSYVYVDGAGDEKVLKEVVTGFRNSTVVEIKEGLDLGEVIYIQSQASEELE